MTTEPSTLVEALARSVARRGDAPALVFDGRVLSFLDLHHRSNQVARALCSAGVGAGARVALLDRTCPEHFEVLYGCAKNGSVYVPVNWRLAPREVAEVLDDAQAEILFVGEQFVGTVAALRESGRLSTLRAVVVLGKSDDGSDYECWRAAHDTTDMQRPVAAGDVVLQMYTSGTTGLPKGVLLTHANLCSAATIAAGWGLAADDAVSLVCMPLFHMSGTSWAMLGLYYGATLVLLRDADPQLVRATMAQHHVTHALLVPTLLQLVLAVPDADDHDFTTLRVVVYGGSPISEQLLVTGLERVGCEFIQLYGLTESTGLATMLSPQDHHTGGPSARLLKSVGTAAPGVELRVVDPETGLDRAPGEVGEIWLRSGQVMAGYWRQPEATAQVLDDDGWLHTGDAAHLDEHGHVFIVDRVKDMVVSGGENVYPAEVERVLVEHPAVAEVAVIGVPDPTWGETVMAVVVAAQALSADELIAFARDRLAHYKCPRRVDFVDALPRNSTGKVLKRDLRERWWHGQSRRVG